MNLSEICIRRPVFAWVLVSWPVVLGLLSYFRLGVDLFPNVDFPVCVVTTTLPGASAEEMETSVTKVIEDAVNTISGVDSIRSTSGEGISLVIVQFALTKNGDVGAQEVRDKIGTILALLPEGSDPPVVDRFDTEAMPIMTVVVSGNRDLREITEIARRQVKEQIETVSGVGAAMLLGGRQRSINVTVDPDRLIAYGLSIEDVKLALQRQNLEVPGGRVDEGARELVVRTLGRLNTAEQFNDLIITDRDGYPVRVRDVGEAVEGVEEPRSLSRLNGRDAVSVIVQKQSGTNVVTVTDAVHKRLNRVKGALPPDIKMEIIRDQSRWVRKSIEEVQFHLLLAGVLVSATIMLFIRDWRTTLIATLAIPTSIVPTFAFMYYMGFTLNNITMLGLILAIGIVIDDAVVVHENIFRLMEEDGLNGMEAARRGTREIALPVMATSLSLVIIFVPLAFMGGIVGRFFSSFGLTVAFAITMSLFVSFTLTPMLCSRFLKLEADHSGKAKSKSGFVWRNLDKWYGRLLAWSLRHRFAIVALTILTFFSTVPIGRIMGLNLIPRDDQSEYEVAITTPEGYTLQRTAAILTELEHRLHKVRGTVYTFSSVGTFGRNGKGQGAVTTGTVYVRMKELEDREYSQFVVQEEVRRMMVEYPDLRAGVNDVSPFQGGGRAQVFQVELNGPDLEKLAEYATELKGKLAEAGGISDLDTTLSLRNPELQVVVDREAASDLGISVGAVADTLRVLVGGMIVSSFREQGQQYDIWLRAQARDRSSIEDLYGLTVASPAVGPVSVSNLADVVERRGPSVIERKDRQRIVTVLGNPSGIALGDCVERARKYMADMKLPPEYSVSFGGQAETLGETVYFLGIAVLMSIVFMYLILAAQFESWTQPVAILMALPVTLPFALLSLVLARTPMDIYAMFGLFMLIGIVKKNGILQVDCTNQLRAQGRNLFEAILEANHTRLRPILMTTVMLVAAMIPIALGQGPGAGARASMAKVIIGGQSLSLVLALIVTPVFYHLLDGLVRFAYRHGLRFSVEHEPSRSAAADSPGAAEAAAAENGAALAGNGVKDGATAGAGNGSHDLGEHAGREHQSVG
ncbi:MAG: efflux RND transporter permease subunit [Pirellulales bacterium]|nr:efflux RND transporter permease subunit [Pirellulales bacterium]